MTSKAAPTGVSNGASIGHVKEMRVPILLPGIVLMTETKN